MNVPAGAAATTPGSTSLSDPARTAEVGTQPSTRTRVQPPRDSRTWIGVSAGTCATASPSGAFRISTPRDNVPMALGATAGSDSSSASRGGGGAGPAVSAAASVSAAGCVTEDSGSQPTSSISSQRPSAPTRRTPTPSTSCPRIRPFGAARRFSLSGATR